MKREQQLDKSTIEAQFIHTRAYLESGLITEDQLDDDGIYRDEYTSRSEPIVVNTGSKRTSVRMIHADAKKGGLLSLPTAKHFQVDPELIKDVAGVPRLSDISAKKVVEISGLGSIEGDDMTVEQVFDATRQAYATGLRRSLDEGHQLWMMNVEPRLSKHLSLILGKNAITQIGREQDYMSPPTIPIALNPQSVVKSVFLGEGRSPDMNKSDLRNTLQGVSEKHLNPDLIKLLHENDIETMKTSLLNAAWKRKKTILYGGILAYSTVRAVPLITGGLTEFDGNGFVFGGIDIATAVTQLYGQEMYLKSKDRTRRALGATVAISSFVAPYAYVEATGHDYPWGVQALIGGLLGIGATTEVMKSVKDHQLRKGLEATDIPIV